MKATYQLSFYRKYLTQYTTLLQVLQDEGHLPVIYVPVQLLEVPQRRQQVPWEGGPQEETQALPDVSHLC